MRIRVKEQLSSNELRELGYHLSVKEGGYVSEDEATIIYLFRKPYNGEALPYKFGAGKEHKANIQRLRDEGYLEEK